MHNPHCWHKTRIQLHFDLSPSCNPEKVGINQTWYTGWVDFFFDNVTNWKYSKLGQAVSMAGISIAFTFLGRFIAPHFPSVYIAFFYFFVGAVLGYSDLNCTLILITKPLKLNKPTAKGHCEHNNEGTVTEGVCSKSTASQHSTPWSLRTLGSILACSQLKGVKGVN